MFGLFKDPKCPHCGHELTYTGASFPYPEWKCTNCIKNNREKREQASEMADLKKRIKVLEGKEGVTTDGS